MRSELQLAIAALAAPRYRIVNAANHVPKEPGLYALYGKPDTWQALGLGVPTDDRPLYVGKAERSLASRDLATHFRTGRTPVSTVRRTLAALLQQTLSLNAVLRNKPTHFGLEPDDDERLTSWMSEKLTLALWGKPAELPRLADVELAVIQRFIPPLNLQGNRGSPWKVTVRLARRAMADSLRSPP